jgi:hypothetical protein
MSKFVLLLFFLIQCSKLPDQALNSILSILSENEIIQSDLLSEKIPNLDSLKSKVKSSLEITKDIPELNAKLNKLNSILLKSSSVKEEVYLVLSEFSEALGDILISNNIKTEHHKFYCPMVSKYWIAKGTEVKNPYAPEMRDCGELIK